MIRNMIPILAVSAALNLAAAQTAAGLRAPAPAAVTRKAAELTKADRAWRDADRGLEGKLLTSSRSSILARLREAEARMIARGQALQAYNQELIQHARQMLEDLESGADRHTAAGEAMTENVDRLNRQIGEIEERIATLEARLAALPSDGSPEDNVARERVEAQLRATTAVRENLTRQSALSNTIASLTQDSGRAPMIAQARALVESLKRELDHGNRETGLWSDYYRALREHVMAAREQQREEPW